MLKTSAGNFFEDFNLGQKIVHATPRTITAGDQALYTALYGSRFAVQSSDEFARAIGYPKSPLDDLLVFNIVFGKTVPDISLNAIANLGYAECVFSNPVYSGDTLSARSEVIGLKENSNGKTGTVYVRSKGINQHGEEVLSFVRWVMVRKRDEKSAPPAAHVPELLKVANVKTELPRVDMAKWNFELSGSPHRFDDYAIGEKIDHLDGMTVEEAEHQLATRLYQNTARVHFNQFAEASGRFGRRLIYGGHVMSLARALSFNGLANAYHIAASMRAATLLRFLRGELYSPGRKLLTRLRMAMLALCALSRGPRAICLAVNFRLKTEHLKSLALFWNWITGP